ncbi:MAG: thiamine-phosphate kinase [Proteobacteria bacterium]|nr:thiamine-phosphate kinase [Pseudomonadota bacterium]
MSLSEFKLINKYFKDLTAVQNDVICGIGDDAAIINIPAHKELVVSVDTLVNGVHFLPATDPYDIGFKSLAVNLSDMAAMAAQPRWATLSLTMPDNDAAWLESFSKGFKDLAQQYSVALVGGDLTHGPLTITIQILGLVATGAAIKRSGARPGDAIYVSGCLGAAALALKVLNKEIQGVSTLSASCNRHLLQPVPRIDIGNNLQGIATSAIDISDGLIADLGHILKASSVGAVIELDTVPLCKELNKVTDQDLVWQLSLCSGDDYELCFTVPSSRKDELDSKLSAVDCPISCIGVIQEGSVLRCLLADGSEYDIKAAGYRHF